VSPVRAAQTNKDKKRGQTTHDIASDLGGQEEGCVQVMNHQSLAAGPRAKWARPKPRALRNPR